MYNVKISIIIPAYNAEKYIESTLTSLINQSLDSIEIIVINDGSSDQTSKILEKFSIYKNVLVVNQVNKGISEARNKGLELASGEYIGFVDSDDLCEKNMFEEMYKKAKEHNADIVISGIIVDDYKKNYKRTINVNENRYYHNDKKSLLFQLDKSNMFNFVWNKIYKRDIIQNVRFEPNLTTGEDLLFNCTIFKENHTVYLMNSAYYHYIRRDEPTTVTKYKEDLFAIVERLNKEREQLYSLWGMTEEKYINMLARKCIEYYISCVLNLFRPDNGLKFKEQFYNYCEIMDAVKISNIKCLSSHNFNEKIFSICYQIRFNFLGYLFYKILFFIRYRLSILYNIFYKKRGI